MIVSLSIVLFLFSQQGFACDGIPCTKERTDELIEKTRISPCNYIESQRYQHGVAVNCCDLGLQSLNSSWFPSSSTDILLERNQLSHLDDSTFQNTKQLRFLSLRKNRLTIIDPKVFAGLHHLEHLDLEHNNLYLDHQSSHLFSNLGNLTSLLLGFNSYSFSSTSTWAYPKNFLKGLNKLQNLSLHTFDEDLEFGNLFQDTLSIRSLVLTGDMKTIRNESFRSLQNTSLVSLSFHGLKFLRKTEVNAFQYLKHLQSYLLSHTNQGLEQALLALYPFQKRNMTSLSFNGLGSRIVSALIRTTAILDGHKSKYLSTICFKHFRLTYTIILSIEPRTLTSKTWQRCLESLELTGIPLIGEPSSLLRIPMMKSLRRFVLSRCYAMASGHFYDKDNRSTYKKRKHISNSTKVLKQKQKAANDFQNLTRLDFFHNENRNKEQVVFPVPPNLEELTFSGCSHNTQITTDFRFLHASKVHYLKFSDNDITKFSAKVSGLTNLEYLDLSYNYRQSMIPSVLDTVPRLKILLLKNMNFHRSYDFGRLLLNLKGLETLDMSSNKLNRINSNSFQTTTTLKELDLSENKLTSLSIDISTLTQLHSLDLSKNSITSLSKTEIQSLEQCREQTGILSVCIDGNPLSCDCSNFRFLAWLNRTFINLDNNRDYRCLGEDGHFRTTGLLIKDLDAMWRKCHGITALLIALVLWVSVILIFILVFCISHFKTLVVNTTVAIFVPNLKLKSREDYKYGVYLGYSNADYRFACFDLRQFLEDRLKVTTYIRDRDLLNQDMDDQIFEAINASWRVIFIVTNDFLRLDNWMYLAVKAAVYSVNPLNPRKVVLMADVNVINQIPGSLLQVIPDENIVKMEMPFQLKYEECEALKNIIL